MQIAAEMAYLASNTPSYWETLAPQPDGSVIVTTFMPDIYRAAGFVFSYGPAATVIEPENLRQLIYMWASKMAAQYQPFYAPARQS